jgi:glycosyltransferase involved in cell wall biosynthesis
MSRVTVLIPNYNNARYLRQCLASVLGQTARDWTAVVGDNASTDQSVDVVTALADPRVRLVRRETTISWVANVNQLLREAGDSEYVAVLHADDWWEPAFVETMTAMLEAAPRSMLASCAATIVRDDGPPGISGLHLAWKGPATTCPSRVASRLLAQKNWLRSPAVMARGSLYARFPGYDESLPLVNDWLMWLRATTVGDVEVSRGALANYRFHSGNLSADSTRDNRWGEEMMRMLAILQTEWRDEPFPGARQAIAAGVTSEILADAGLRAERGDTAGALIQTRRARSIAPALKQRVLAAMAEEAIRVTDWPGVRHARRPAARVGRRLWKVLRPAA